MEYDFIYRRDSKQYQLKLGTEHTALGRFLLEEFEHSARAYQPLIDAIRGLTCYQHWQYDGREFSLQIDNAEVQIVHHSLLSDTELLDELLLEEQLSVDEQALFCECGVEDLLALLNDWQDFLRR